MVIVVCHYHRRVSERQALNRGCLEGLKVGIRVDKLWVLDELWVLDK